MLRNTVLSIGLLSSYFACAQDYRPGFILKLNGDSVKGFINYGSRKSKSVVCHFKTSKKAKKIVYAPADIKGYGFNGDRSYEVKNISKKDPEFRFLEILVKGKVSLYRNLILFYLEKDSLFVLSKDPQTVFVAGGIVHKSTTLKYVGVLNYVLSDCNLKADKVSYDEKGLVNLIQSYNLCKGEVAPVYKKKPWIKVTGFVLSGVDQASVKLDGFPGDTFKKTVSVPVGLGMSLNAPKWNDKTHFSIELWYDRKLYQGYSETLTYALTKRTDVVINSSYLKMPIGIRLNLSQEENTPYFKVGFVQYFLLNASGTVTSEVETYDVVSTTLSDALIKKKNTNGLWAGVGYSKKIYSRYIAFGEFRYEKNNGFTSSGVDSSSAGTVLNLLVGFKF